MVGYRGNGERLQVSSMKNLHKPSRNNLDRKKCDADLLSDRKDAVSHELTHEVSGKLRLPMTITIRAIMTE